jgi:hypothetical protein
MARAVGFRLTGIANSPATEVGTSSVWRVRTSN